MGQEPDRRADPPLPGGRFLKPALWYIRPERCANSGLACERYLAGDAIGLPFSTT
jgi:hypothetical protein